MNQLNRYRELLDQKSKVVQLIELYRNAGIYKFVDRYVMLKWKIDTELSRLRNSLLVVNQ